MVSRIRTWLNRPATGVEFALGFGILMALFGFCGGFMLGVMKCLQ